MFPILSIFTFNMGQMPYGERQIAIPLLVSVLSAAAIWGVLSLILKNSLKAGLITSILVLLFFSYGHIYSFLIAANISFTIRYPHLTALWMIIIIVSGALIIRTKRDLKNITTILNIMSITLALLPTANYLANKAMISSAGLKTKTAEQSGENVAAIKSPVEPRDIYYVILDGYSNETTMKEVFNCDISDFTSFLKKKGFFVASKSRSNYAFTDLSIPSSLNMKFLDGDMDPLRKKQRAYLLITARLRTMLEDHKVKDFLKARGYKLIFFSSGFQVDNQNRYFDVPNRCGRDNEFMYNLLNTTALAPLHGYYVVKKLENAREKITSCVQDEITKIPEKGPLFVFAHLDVSHVNMFHEAAPSYCGELKAYNKRLETMVSGILSASKKPPIIVLQGDHGTKTILDEIMGEDGKWDMNKLLANEPLMDAGLRQRMRIFNAYYFPAGGEAKLYDSITPVNTFRVMFDYYFGADFKLMDDRSYFSFPPRNYEFVDVTERAKF